MFAVEFILDTFAHFVKYDEGPPPGIPAHAGPGFEQDLLRISERQRLSPLVVYSLERLVLQPGLSRLSFERLKRDAKRSRRTNERLLIKLGHTASLFRKKGIPWLVMGGAAASQSAYPDPDLRSIGRIDFLVKEMNWKGVLECLYAAGFRQAGGRREVEAAQDALRYHQLAIPCVFRDSDGDEVHISFRLFRLGIPEEKESAWSRGSTAEASAPFEQMPSPEDLLIRQALDLIVSDFSDLRLMLDIAFLLTRNRRTLDWKYMEKRLRYRGYYAGFYFAVERVGDLLQLPKPCADLPHPGGLRKRFFEFAWNTVEPDYLAAVDDKQHNLKFALLESPTLGARAALLQAVLSPAHEWISAFYGRPCNKQLKLQFIGRVLGGKWMKAGRPQEEFQETSTMKPGQRLLE